MSATVTLDQQELVEALVSRGRYRNKSEAIRAGLELLRAKLDAEDLRPLSDAERAAATGAMTEEEIESDRQLGKASLEAQKGTA